MDITKHILLVDRRDGRLAALAEDLKARHYKVVLVPGLDQARRSLELFPKLAVLAVAEELAGEQAKTDQFFVDLRDRHPEIPVIWCAADETQHSAPSKPDAVLAEPVRADALVEQSDTLLSGRYYPAELAQHIVDGTLSALETFGKFSHSEDVFLKTNRTVLSDISATIDFQGPNIGGLLIVTAPRRLLLDMHRHTFGAAAGDPTLTQMEDMTGEICNQVLGKIKLFFSARSVELRLGLPLFFTGKNTRVRRRSNAPALAVGIAHDGEALFVEFSLEALDLETFHRPATPEDPDSADSGDLVFL